MSSVHEQLKRVQSAPLAGPRARQTPPKVKPVVSDYAKRFHAVYTNRLKYYHRLALVVALVAVALLSIPYGGGIVMYPTKVFVVWGAFAVVKAMRDSTIRVEAQGSVTEIQHIVQSVFSVDAIVALAGYVGATVLIYLVVFFQSSDRVSYQVASPTKTVKPFLNDSFMLFWFYAVFTAGFYTLQFTVFEKNRLHFRVGQVRTEPTDQLRKIKPLALAREAGTISGCIFVLAGLSYLFSRRFLFNWVFYPMVVALDLNSQVPSLRFSPLLYLALTFVSFVTVFAFELLNKMYNAYALTGCLVVKKPISELSPTQMQTLVSGLADYSDSFSRLTAYQELVYRSSKAALPERKCLYEAENWAVVLSQVTRVISASSRAARMALPGSKPKKAEPAKPAPEETTIFGRTTINEDSAEFQDAVSSNDIRPDLFSAKVRPEDLFVKPPTTAAPKPAKKGPTFVDLLIERAEKALVGILEKSEKKAISTVKETVLSVIGGPNVKKFSAKLNSTLLVKSYRREAERRIPNKALTGDAIVAVSEVLLHARTEDVKNVVVGTLTEVLNLLTRIYGSTSEFLENPPVKPKDANEKDHNAVREINELAISYFFKLVVSYNSVLNDLILTPETFKLAKWCTDVALEEQRNM